MKKNSYSSCGQTLVEALIMIGLLSIFLPALITGLVVSRSSKPQQEQRTKASLLLRETQEAIRNIREAGWIAFAVNGTYHPVISGANWQFATGSATINGFTQQVDVSDVYRDTNGAIATSGGTLDPSTKLVLTTITWTQPYLESVETTNYFTRYLDNLAYTQTTDTDFNAGTLNNVAVTNTAGGEVQLANNNKAKWCSPSFSSS